MGIMYHASILVEVYFVPVFLYPLVNDAILIAVYMIIISSTGIGGLVLFPAIFEGLDKTCTNLSIILFNDDWISPPRSDSIMLETYKTFDDRIIFSPGTNATLTIEDDGIYI